MALPTLAHAPADPTLADLRARHEREEVEVLRAALRRAEGRIQPAAKALGLAYSVLYRLVHVRYSLDLAGEATSELGPRRKASVDL